MPSTLERRNFMENLSDQYKLKLAASWTELAIQNNFFSKSENVEEMAKDVTKFFKTVFETADSDIA